MIDLGPRYAKLAILVPSSMAAGNTTSDDPQLAMTAPGSHPVNPGPDTKDHLPLPETSDAQIALSSAPKKPRPLPSPHPGGGTFDLPSWGGSWKPTEGK